MGGGLDSRSQADSFFSLGVSQRLFFFLPPSSVLLRVLRLD